MLTAKSIATRWQVVIKDATYPRQLSTFFIQLCAALGFRK